MSNYPKTSLAFIGAAWLPKKKGSKVLASFILDDDAISDIENIIKSAREVDTKDNVRGVILRNSKREKDSHPHFKLAISVEEDFEMQEGEDDNPFADGADWIDGEDGDSEEDPFA